MYYIDLRPEILGVVFDNKKAAIKKGGSAEKNNPCLVAPLIAAEEWGGRVAKLIQITIGIPDSGFPLKMIIKRGLLEILRHLLLILLKM